MKLELSLLTTLAFFGMNTYAQDNAKTDKVLVAYFSWSGNTQHVAEYIAQQTGGTLFRVEPLKPYPEEYVPCTEVAKKEKEDNTRPAIKDRVEDWDSYDTVFIGCPDDHQHIRRKLRLQRKDSHTFLHICGNLP